MSKRFERLKCSKCGFLLERRYSNNYLNLNYPVDSTEGLEREFNMKLHRESKRMWICPNCYNLVELSILQFALIILDNLRGNYIIE